ncbi:MAG: hypothetical protein ABI873_06660 [Marmoricola sp.]
MPHRRRGTPSTPDDDPEDQGPAPADLLQMWISGRTAPLHEVVGAESAGSDTVEPEPTAPEDQVEDSGPERVQPEAAEPETVEPEAAAVDEQHGDNLAEVDLAEPDAETDEVRADDTQTEFPETAPDQDPVTPQSWWPSNDQTEVPAEPDADPSQWWPYAGPAAQEPAASEAPVESAVVAAPVPEETAEESRWHDDVEVEWADRGDQVENPARAPDQTAADRVATTAPPKTDVVEEDPLAVDEVAQDDAETPDDAAVAAEESVPVEAVATQPSPTESDEVPRLTTDPEAVTDKARGWASFGTAPTAEDVLDRTDVQPTWSGRFTGGPPVVTPSPWSDASALAPAAATDLGSSGQTQPPADPAVADDPPAGGSPVDHAQLEAAEGSPPDPETTAPAVLPRGLDMSSTAHWTLDDFEQYIGSQSGNELSAWIGDPRTVEPQGSDATDTDVTAGVSDEAEPVTTKRLAPTEPAEVTPRPGAEVEAPSAVQAAVDPDADATPVVDASPSHLAAHATEPPAAPGTMVPSGAAATLRKRPSRVRGLLARMGLTREDDAESPNPAASTPAFESPAPVPSPAEAPAADVPDPSESQAWRNLAVRDVEPVVDEQPARVEPEADPVPDEVAEHEVARATYDPDATEHFDWTTADFDGPPPRAAEPPAAEPVEEASMADTATQPEAAVPPSSEQETDAGLVDDDDQDHQEWYDDNGLRWTSDDGGYTWFSTDGQGWNAEIGEPIEVPVVSPSASAVEPPGSASGEIAPADPGEPRWPSAPTDDNDRLEQAGDVWPTDAAAATGPTAATSAHWPEPDAQPDAHEMPEAEARTTTKAAATEPVDVGKTTGRDGATLPQYVEYKPRGAYRPLLGVLFVVAAILAVVAIFWAVSKGSQAATGIAVGVTGFALAFWWGLLSWTPTIVSVNGATLEVARGADGEQFDLASPKLNIELGDDTRSRSWRATITRPNGTELVIPASAVDAVEFTAIVRHYREQSAKLSETTEGD